MYLLLSATNKGGEVKMGRNNSRVGLFVLMFILFIAPVAALAASPMEDAVQALKAFDGKRGKYATRGCTGSMCSASAAGPVGCEIQVKDNMLMFVEIPTRREYQDPATSKPYNRILMKFNLSSIARQLKDGSFASDSYYIKNTMTFCREDPVATVYMLEIDKKNRSISVIKTGNCTWLYNNDQGEDETVMFRTRINCYSIE